MCTSKPVIPLRICLIHEGFHKYKRCLQRSRWSRSNCASPSFNTTSLTSTNSLNINPEKEAMCRTQHTFSPKRAFEENSSCFTISFTSGAARSPNSQTTLHHLHVPLQIALSIAQPKIFFALLHFCTPLSEARSSKSSQSSNYSVGINFTFFLMEI